MSVVRLNKTNNYTVKRLSNEKGSFKYGDFAKKQ